MKINWIKILKPEIKIKELLPFYNNQQVIDNESYF